MTFTQTETESGYLIAAAASTQSGIYTIRFVAIDAQSRESAVKSCTIAVLGGYGWLTTVTSANADGLAATTRLGNAEDTIAGHTLKLIVTDPGTKVRGDNQACQTCHNWAAAISGTDLCANKVSTFNNRPDKPQILKDLFNKWKAANPSCRD